MVCRWLHSMGRGAEAFAPCRLHGAKSPSNRRPHVLEQVGIPAIDQAAASVLAFSFRTVVGLALALAGFTAIAIPRLVVVALVIAGIAALLNLALRDSARLRSMATTPVAIALAAFSLYMGVTAFWALDGLAALEKASAFFTLSVFGLSSAASIGALGRADSRIVSRWMLGGLLAGIVYLTFEYVFGLPVTEFLVGQSSELADSLAKHESVVDGEINVSTIVLNKNITLVALAFVPTLLITSALPHRWRMMSRIALFAMTALCAWLTESGTAILAMLTGGGLLLLGKFSAPAVQWSVVAGWIIAVVFAVPLGALPAQVGATDWSFLPKSSIRARFYIWSYAADKVMERPLTGIGVRSTRELQPDVSPEVADSNAYRYQPRPGRHSHNGFLQVWLELGGIGAGLLLLLGLAGLKAIASLTPSLARYGYATFATMCVVAAFGYGIWQTWLLAGFVCAILLYMLGVRSARAGSGAD